MRITGKVYEYLSTPRACIFSRIQLPGLASFPVITPENFVVQDLAENSVAGENYWRK
jgi:hypothetical protein